MMDGTELTPLDVRRTWRVITRRRNWLIAAAFVLLAGAVLWWSARSGDKLEVKLVFLGYTNRLIEVNLSRKTTVSAIVLATNIGRTPVELFPHGESHWQAIQTEAEAGLQGFEPVAGAVFPACLYPGETYLIEVTQQSFAEPWSLKMPVVNRGWRSTIEGRWERRFRTRLPAWLKAVMPATPDSVAALGPITNLPPPLAEAAPASRGR